jgi:hypothetical protein
MASLRFAIPCLVPSDTVHVMRYAVDYEPTTILTQA